MSKRKLLKSQLRKPSVSIKNVIPPVTSFCFRYITTNRGYTFNRFQKDFRRENTIRKELDELLLYLSNNSWQEVISCRKRSRYGYETIQYSRICFKANPPGQFAPDITVSVFRFCNQECRLLGVWEEPVLYVIGYDFDHSAYNHGK